MVKSSTKNILSFISFFMLFISFISLVLAIATGLGSAIGVMLIYLVCHVLLSVSIVKEWVLYLKIYRILLWSVNVVIVVLLIVGIFFCILDTSGNGRSKQDIVLIAISLIITVIVAHFTALMIYLFNKYLRQIEANKSYKALIIEP